VPRAPEASAATGSAWRALVLGTLDFALGGIITGSRGPGSQVMYDVSLERREFLVFDDGASDATQPLTLAQHWTGLLRKQACTRSGPSCP
jgi:hypothetical protein